LLSLLLPNSFLVGECEQLQFILSIIPKSLFLIDNKITTSCTSSNPGYPDSDKKILKIPTSNKQQHPENPKILDILIQTKKILKIPTANKQQHPENPKILDILIQTKKILKIHTANKQPHPVNPKILDILIQTKKSSKSTHQINNHILKILESWTS
ncbi:hypothetical protein, partial [Dolichospermum sp. UHCC 0259]|uniref:hypothetical protein n=1 Tax=Dolichospermum sp. UHCC 0259 TaxID=2590010 RepID=UPI001C2D2349